jgi:hypothetical protein
LDYPRFIYACWTYERREDGLYAAYNAVPTLTFTRLSGCAADPAWYAGMLRLLAAE